MPDKWKLTEVAPEQVAHEQFAAPATHAPEAIVNPPETGTAPAPAKKKKTGENPAD